jgi:hypothetical protein
MHSRFGKLSDVQPYEVALPLKKRNGTIVVRTAHVLPPHEVFSALCQRETLQEESLGCPLAALQFWRDFDQQPWIQSHPARGLKASVVFPLSFHGDDATAFHQSSATVMSWSSLLQHGCEWRTRFLFCAIPTSQLTPGAYSILFKILCWSFQALLLGRWFGDPVE